MFTHRLTDATMGCKITEIESGRTLAEFDYSAHEFPKGDSTTKMILSDLGLDDMGRIENDYSIEDGFTGNSAL